MDIIIITGGTVSDQVLSEILSEQSSTDRYVIAADKGLEACLRAGIIPDKIIGDFDSVNHEILDRFTDEGRFVRLNSHKDYTDTHAALEYAIDIWENKALGFNDKIIICGATGTRLDHTLANIGLLMQTVTRGINAVIIDKNNRIRMAMGNMDIEKNKIYPYISLIPFTDYVNDVKLTGFEYSGEHINFKQGESLGVSNSIIADKGRIEFKDGILLIIESTDG